MNQIRIAQGIRACVIVTLALCFAFQQTTDGTPAHGQTGSGAADMILINGFIWTVDGRSRKPKPSPCAAIVSSKSGERRSVGAEGRTHATDRSEGRVRHARFNDNHVHFASAASFFWNLQLMDVHSDEAFVARVKDYVAAHPGEPIRGGGWGAYEQWEIEDSRPAAPRP